jgi:hypothetical protein
MDIHNRVAFICAVTPVFNRSGWWCVRWTNRVPGNVGRPEFIGRDESHYYKATSADQAKAKAKAAWEKSHRQVGSSANRGAALPPSP